MCLLNVKLVEEPTYTYEHMLDGVEGARNIAVSWKNTFCSLYNRSNFARDKTNLENLVEGEGGAVWLISTVMLRECINHLKVEKAAGADGLSAEMITVNVYQLSRFSRTSVLY